MTKNIFLSFVALILFSTQCFAGEDPDDVRTLIKKGRPNGQSPHLLGHYGDLVFDRKTGRPNSLNNSPLLTRGTTFYIQETSERFKK